MATYIKLDTDDQTIVSVATVEDTVDYSNLVPGFILVPSEVSDTETVTTITHYVDTNGDVVRYSDALAQERNNRPEAGYEWNVNTGWTDQRTVPELIEQNTNLIIERLADTDWTQLPDAAPATAAVYLTYRNALRALPSDPNWPEVTFPTDPNIGRLD
jgi:hypothetical protein